jgi:WD40 repeat protein
LQADLALTRQLLARSSELQARQPDASLLLTAQALRRTPDTAKEEARFALLAKLIWPYHVATQLASHKSDVSDLTFSPDGNSLTSASEDQTVQYW